MGKLHLATAAGGVEPRVEDGYSYVRYSHAPRDDWPRGHDYVEWLQARGADLDSMLAESRPTCRPSITRRPGARTWR